MQTFPELKTVTLADGVEDLLLEYMQKSKLNPGDLLPKEEDLAANLNVSRHIVREGVSRLKALGLVESRKKRGMIMKRPSAFAGLRKLVAANLFSPQDRKDFMELRVVLELGMTDFIFAKMTPEKIEKLRSVAGIPHSSVQGYETEITFHATLMEIAENRIASQFREILADAFHPVYQSRTWTDFSLKTSTHYDICDVLEKGNAEEFHAIMRKHFQPYLAVIRNS